MLDGLLIKKCIQGDRAAQEKLYNLYSKRMRGICVRYARSAFEAEDIFQDAFIKVFTRLTDYKNEGSFDGWIRRIVINTAIDAYKKNQTQYMYLSYDVEEEQDIVNPVVNDSLNEEDLLKLLEELPAGYKMVFNLYAIEGYSHKEIGEMLHITEGTSKSQLSKARRYLQDLLYKNGINSNGTREV